MRHCIRYCACAKNPMRFSSTCASIGTNKISRSFDGILKTIRLRSRGCTQVLACKSASIYAIKIVFVSRLPFKVNPTIFPASPHNSSSDACISRDRTLLVMSTLIVSHDTVYRHWYRRERVGSQRASFPPIFTVPPHNDVKRRDGMFGLRLNGDGTWYP